MEKSKLGLPIPVMGALTYLLFCFGGYVAGLLVTGYILLREEDAGLKKTAITAILTAIAVSLVNLLIGLLPDVVDVFRTLVAIFGEYMDGGIISSIAGFLYAVLAVVKTVAFVGLAALELLKKPIRISLVDKLLDN